MDLSSISTLLSSIKTATDLAKLIKGSGVTLDQAETKLKLAELISSLADAKITVADVQQALLDKDSEIRALKDQLKIKGALRWESPYYWLEVGGSPSDGPYCQRCYDKDKMLIRLQGSGNGYWECKSCTSGYMDKNYDRSCGVMSRRRDHDPYRGF